MEADSSDLDRCTCTLISSCGDNQISAWDNFSQPDISLPSEQKKISLKSSKRLVPRVNLGYDTSKVKRYKFQHHKNSREYINDYNEAFLKTAARQKTYAPNATKYSSTYGLHVDLPSTGSRVHRRVIPGGGGRGSFESSSGSQVETVRKFLESCYVQPSKEKQTIPTTSDYNSDSIIDECENDAQSANTVPPKPRKLLEINLTGKFVKRENTMTRSATKLELTCIPNQCKCKPNEHVKLPVPQRPAPAISYKLPARIPRRTNTGKSPSQSAKFQRHLRRQRTELASSETERKQVTTSLESPQKITTTSLESPQKTTTTSIESPQKITTTSTESPQKKTQQVLLSKALTNINFTIPTARLVKSPNYKSSSDGPENKLSKKDPTFTSTTSSNRSKQLEQLVKILGDRTLTPYLTRLKNVVQGPVSQPLCRADSAERNAIFGSRI